MKTLVTLSLACVLALSVAACNTTGTSYDKFGNTSNGDGDSTGLGGPGDSTGAGPDGSTGVQ